MQPPRTALVTGAGRGIGAAVAAHLAQAGYRLALLGRTRVHLEDVAARLAATGSDALVLAVDVLDAPAVRAAVEQAEQHLGGIGLLVNNAGVIEHEEADFVHTDLDDTWRVIETNVRGPLVVTHAVLPAMLARGSGRVLNINSGSGHRPQDAYTGYAISKGALARFTTQLDRQYRAAGLRVLDLAPGVVATSMTSGMPVHADRTQWTDPADVGELVRAFGDGELDELSGRFVRAGVDTVGWLRERAGAIVAADARTLRLVGVDPDDPVA